jgi:hypothetical protein
MIVKPRVGLAYETRRNIARALGLARLSPRYDLTQQRIAVITLNIL